MPELNLPKMLFLKMMLFNRAEVRNRSERRAQRKRMRLTLNVNVGGVHEAPRI